MSVADSPPATPLDEIPPPDFNNRDVLEGMIKDNYRKLTNRINIRDFLPRLREKGFSLADQQEVQHEITTVDKNMKLLDLVLHKDTQCLQVFAEVLEYDYEDLYLKMTGVKARQRPMSWRQIERPSSRMSMQALTGIVDTMSGILTELTKNHNTMQNLASQVQGVWTKTSQEQKNEEHEMVRVKDTLDKLKTENVTVTWENKVLKTRLAKERQKTEKLNVVDERLRQLRKELNSKEEQLQQMESEVGVNKTKPAHTRESQITDPRMKTLINQNIEMERDLQNAQSEKKQLQDELEESEKKIVQLTDRVDDLREENTSLRTKLDELETHCYWQERKEKRQHSMDYPIYGQGSFIRDHIEEDPDPYSTIPVVGLSSTKAILRQPSVVPEVAQIEEAIHIEESARMALKTATLEEDDTLLDEDLNPNACRGDDVISPDLSSMSFPAQIWRHGRYKGARTNITENLSRLRKTLSDVDLFVSEDCKQNYKVEKLDVGDLVHHDFINHDVTRGIISTLEVTSKDLLETITLAGGNHCGIFVNSIKHTDHNKPTKVKVGDHLMKLQPMACDDMSAVCLGDCTLEDAHNKLQREKGKVQLFLWSGSELYKKYHNRKNKDYKGDLFCVQVNTKTSTIEVDGSRQPLEYGDILLVLDTYVGKGIVRKWFARRLEPHFGKFKEPRLAGLVESQPASDVTAEAKQLYKYVKPWTPQFARPVLLFGESKAISQVLQVVSTDIQFKRDNTEADMPGSPAEKLINQIKLFEVKHLIVEGQLYVLRELLKRRIFPIVVRVKSDCGSRIVEDVLIDSDLPKNSIQELELTEKTLTEEKDILILLKSLVTQAQRHLIWLEVKQPMLPI